MPTKLRELSQRLFRQQLGKPGLLIPVATITLLAWFFAASFYTASIKTIGNDDAMFIAIVKNFLNGFGWATGYGEKILFNPDISTGPGLLLPGLLMVFIFGNQFWVPAITATLLHILLTSLILWQLYRADSLPKLTVTAFTLTVIIATGRSFIEYSAYCTTILLFVFCLSYNCNPNNSKTKKMLLYGAGACIALYTKPLGFSLFLVCLPFLILEKHADIKKTGFNLLLVVTAFLVLFSPWQIFKSYQLSQQSEVFQQAHQAYGKKFFAEHGSGIAQLQRSDNILSHLTSNSIRNNKILDKSLQGRYGLNSLSVYLLLIGLGIWQLWRIKYNGWSFSASLNLLLILSAIAQAIWFVVFSFAILAGHTFYFQFLLILVIFVSLSQLDWKIAAPVAIVLFIVFFNQGENRVKESLSFGYHEPIISAEELSRVIDFIQNNELQKPLAGCGYTTMPKIIDYLLPESGQIKDCNHLLADSLVFENGHYHWQENIKFTGVFIALLAPFITQPEQELYGPILHHCLTTTLYRDNVHLICEINMADVKGMPSPDRAAELIEESQEWYRTRLAH